MIKIDNFEVVGWEAAIRGMRNPLLSHNLIDSDFSGDAPEWGFLGSNDHKLMTNLANAGPSHSKYRRMIVVYADITAPMYWWSQFDCYKVGTVANSCSKMHKIHAKEFELSDFSTDHLNRAGILIIESIIAALNACRDAYNDGDYKGDKEVWYQMIQLLPNSYNQKRTVMLNYEVLAAIYDQRKNHKLDEWIEFCSWIESLPYSDIIIGRKKLLNELYDGFDVVRTIDDGR